MAWLTAESEVVWVAIATGVLVPAALAWFAWRAANAWQRREVTLRLLDELNSPEMMEARASAVGMLKRMEAKFCAEANKRGQCSLTPTDFKDSVAGWLVFKDDGDRKELQWAANLQSEDAINAMRLQNRLKCDEIELFRQNHGFAKMLYFLGKVALMRRKGMVDEDVLFPSLAHFFLHYEMQITAFLDACNDEMSSLERSYQPVWYYGPRDFYAFNEELRRNGRFGGGLTWWRKLRRRGRVRMPLRSYVNDQKLITHNRVGEQSPTATQQAPSETTSATRSASAPPPTS